MRLYHHHVHVIVNTKTLNGMARGKQRAEKLRVATRAEAAHAAHKTLGFPDRGTLSRGARHHYCMLHEWTHLRAFPEMRNPASRPTPMATVQRRHSVFLIWDLNREEILLLCALLPGTAHCA